MSYENGKSLNVYWIMVTDYRYASQNKLDQESFASPVKTGSKSNAITESIHL